MVGAFVRAMSSRPTAEGLPKLKPSAQAFAAPATDVVEREEVEGAGPTGTGMAALSPGCRPVARAPRRGLFRESYSRSAAHEHSVAEHCQAVKTSSVALRYEAFCGQS